MKFDVVIGNPPYQGPTKASKKLWPQFISKAFELVKDGGAVYLITPTTWLNRKLRGAWRSYANFDVVSLISDLTPWFPTVGTNPGAPLAFKRPYGGSTRVDDVFEVDLHTDPLPVNHKHLNPESIEFLREMAANHAPVKGLAGCGPAWGDSSWSAVKTDTHVYETYYASSKNRRSVWSNAPRAAHGELKLVVGRYGDTEKTCEITTKGVGPLAVYVPGSQTELENLRALLLHPSNRRWLQLMSTDAWTEPLHWISSKPA